MDKPAGWELVSECEPAYRNYEKHEKTERFPVPGGWLYRTCVYTDDSVSGSISVALVFVPNNAI